MYKDYKRWLSRFFVVFFVVPLALAITPPVMIAQENCLECHADSGTEVKGSVHSFLSCVSCHTNIEGFPHPAEASLDKKESVATCSDCHQGRVAESYKQSFHGKAVELGSVRSASCVDCHGAHEVLRESNPNSMVAKENVPETCATCHGKASPGFAQGEEHFLLDAVGPGAPMYYTAKFFVWLTIITIVGMVIHIELQLYHNLRRILKERKGIK